MAIITIQIRGLTMVRNRTGEELSDPVTELEEGAGDAGVVVAHFDLGRQYRPLPHESVFELYGSEGEDSYSAELNHMGVHAQVGSQAANTGEHQSEGQEDQGKERGERLKKRLRQRGKDGLRAWLAELAKEAAQSPELLELFMAWRVPGAFVRLRLRVSSAGELEARVTARPPPQRKSKLSVLGVRGPSALPGCVAEARGQLRRDGTLEAIRLTVGPDGLPPPTPEVSALLDRLRGRPAEWLAHELERGSKEHPTLGPQLLFDQMVALEAIRAEVTEAFGDPAPVFGELVHPEETPEAEDDGAPCYALAWDDRDQPLWLVDTDDAPDEAALGRDLTRLQHLAAVLGTAVEEDEAA